MTASLTAALAGLTARASARWAQPSNVGDSAVARRCARLARAHAIAWPTGVEYPAAMTVALAPPLWDTFSRALETNTAALEAHVRCLLRLPQGARSPRLRCVRADIPVPFTVTLEPRTHGAPSAAALSQSRARETRARLRDEVTGRVIAIPAAGLVLGRTVPGEGRLDDPTVSGQHARLDWKEATLRVVDLGSKNGTVVDGRHTAAQALWHGDLLVLGRSALRVIHPAADVAVTRRLQDGTALTPVVPRDVAARPDQRDRHHPEPAEPYVVTTAGPSSAEVHAPTQPLTSAPAPTTCLTVTVHTDALVATVWLAGELDVTCGSTMAQTVDHLRRTPPRHVVLDVSRLRFCDARGLAAILSFRSQIHGMGEEMTLRGSDPRMRLLLHLTGLDHLLD